MGLELWDVKFKAVFDGMVRYGDHGPAEYGRDAIPKANTTAAADVRSALRRPEISYCTLLFRQ